MCALNPLFEHPAAITGRINFKRADLAEFVGFAGDWSSVVQLVPTPQPPFPRAEGGCATVLLLSSRRRCPPAPPSSVSLEKQLCGVRKSFSRDKRHRLSWVFIQVWVLLVAWQPLAQDRAERSIVQMPWPKSLPSLGWGEFWHRYSR